jgi:glycosyltransferase involved in cell wall biosynthesis
MRNKPTITIGIPAYNEEKNIANLLQSILAQKQNNFYLEQILVVFDGNDKTGELVKKFSKKYPFIKLYQRNQRLGKANALNYIYKTHTSDLLLTLDADISFVKDNDIAIMVRALMRNKKANLVGPRHIPIKPKTLMGKFAYISYVSFEDAYLHINNGNNFYAVMLAELMRKEFTKSFTFPEGTISDQIYVAAMATKNNPRGFKLVKEAQVYFRPVTTFQDWRVLGVRSAIMDKQNAIDLIGKDVLKLYTMPRPLYTKSLIKWFFKSPLYMAGSVLMNIYIRVFPYEKVMPKDGMWTLTESSRSMEVSTA